ncbi:hypothetical protein LIER_08888 [Lithospermum erythrorhizon]|uniref:Uncharacterized protein n=1 Tax=Lithospermum erythrorhizon TaxID=34254 RepID=A0AAV3PIE9_LITER
MNIYIDSCPKNEFLRLYSNELPLRKLSCEGSVHRVISDDESKDEEAREYEEYEVIDVTDNDTIFFRKMDTFDDKLDKEIKEENIELQRKKAEEIENIARENEMEMRSVESGSFIPKKTFVETYVRHGEEFKLRKAT